MFSRIIKDSRNIPKTFGYKLRHNMTTLEDEEEAYTKPQWAYYFAKNVPGADIEKCQEAACKYPYWAYMFAKHIPGADIEKCNKLSESYTLLLKTHHFQS